jgi:Protein of unknown function (DUF4058)
MDAMKSPFPGMDPFIEARELWEVFRDDLIVETSNKRRSTLGWKKYLRKRQGLLLGEANLVEIDLLRGGDRMPMLDA